MALSRKPWGDGRFEFVIRPVRGRSGQAPCPARLMVSPPFGFESTLRNDRNLLGQEMRRVEGQDNDRDPSEERHASDKHAPERFIGEIEPHR